MGKYINQDWLRGRRRSLRRQSTSTEEILWNHLRNRKLHGFKFKRQYSIGSYILDFYCVDRKLCIEIDGGYHDDPRQREYDKIREAEIKSSGIKIIRFTNDQVTTNLPSVLNAIKNNL